MLRVLLVAFFLAGCAGNAAPGSTPVPTAPGESWPVYSAAGGRAHFAYPPGWQETSPGSLSGADGFARVEVISSQGAGPGTVCQGEAIRDKPARYGALPEIRDLQIGSQPACLILPSTDQPAGRGVESALFVWLPPAQGASGMDAANTDAGNDLLVLRASQEVIAAISESLSLPGSVETTSNCDFIPSSQPAEITRAAGLRVDAFPVARAGGCIPTLQPTDFYRHINTGEPSARLQAARARQFSAERIQRLNDHLRPFGLGMQTYGEGLFRLRKDSETLRENISWVGQFSASRSGDDFLLPLVDGYNATAFLANSSGVQALTDPDLLVYDNVFPVIAGDARIRLAYDYETIPRPPGNPALLRVYQDEQEIQVISVSGATAAGGPARGLWSDQGSWFLQLPGMVIQDGQILNDRLGCAEMFGWRLLKEKPFTFCRKDGSIQALYGGETLPLAFDEVIYLPQTGAAAAVQLRAYESGMAFLARKDAVWYYVVIEAE